MSWIEIFAVVCLIGSFTYGAYSFYKQDKEFGYFNDFDNLKKDTK